MAHGSSRSSRAADRTWRLRRPGARCGRYVPSARSPHGNRRVSSGSSGRTSCRWPLGGRTSVATLQTMRLHLSETLSPRRRTPCRESPRRAGGPAASLRCIDACMTWGATRTRRSGPSSGVKGTRTSRAGARTRSRTWNLGIKSPLLYRLSYAGGPRTDAEGATGILAAAVGRARSGRRAPWVAIPSHPTRSGAADRGPPRPARPPSGRPRAGSGRGRGSIRPPAGAGGSGGRWRRPPGCSRG